MNRGDGCQDGQVARVFVEDVFEEFEGAGGEPDDAGVGGLAGLAAEVDASWSGLQCPIPSAPAPVDLYWVVRASAAV